MYLIFPHMINAHFEFLNRFVFPLLPADFIQPEPANKFTHKSWRHQNTTAGATAILNSTPPVSGTRSRRRRDWVICFLPTSKNTPKNNKRLCRPSFTESQQSLFRSQYRIGCDSKPANHSLAKIRTNKMALVSAIILLSNRKWDFQKASVFRALQPIMFTFFSFPLAKWKRALSFFV